MEDRSEIEALLSRYALAYRAGDAAGCAAVFTGDAVLMSPYGPAAHGRAQIAALHADWTAEGGADKRLTVEGFGQDGDLAWCLARFSEGAAGDGLTLAVLSRQPGGGWLIRMASLNAADPAPV